MNDNWWVMKQMIERSRAWTLHGRSRARERGVLRQARIVLGRALISWGRALASPCRQENEREPALRTS